jgi:carbon-monoxide dehydrogenase large subunit
MNDSVRSKYVGSPILRQEDERLLLGRARFIDDIPEPAGTVHVVFLRSSYPHARIRSIDVSAAASFPGVVAVFTGAQIAESTKPMLSPTLPGQPKLIRQNMAVEFVRYVGEAVAAVVAEDRYVAEDAVELIEVDFEPLTPVLTVEEATAPGAALVHDYLPSNIIFNTKGGTPGTDDVFANAQHVIGDVFHSGRVSAVPMETRGFLTRFDHGTNKLEHFSTAQFPHKMRWEIADALQLPEKNVQVSAPHVGGSFGMKTVTFQEDVVGAVIARQLGRPVKWLQDRQDDLALMHGRDFHFGVEIACAHDGTLLGVRTKMHVDIGAYPLWIATSGLDAGGAAHHMMGPYKVPHYAFDSSTVLSNKAPLVSYRGVAAPICVFAMETLLEKMAARIGLDAIQIRRRNLIQPKDLPYLNAVGVTHDTASHTECLDRALEMVGYEDYRRAHTGELEADGKYRGIAVVCVSDHTGQGTSIARSRGQASRWPGYDAAIIRMEPDGKVIAYTSFASQGQGHHTVFAQIIADQLGLAMEDVTVEQGDTATAPFGTGAGASRAAVVGGGAVLKASQRVAAKLRRIAAHILEVSPGEVALEDGKALVTGGSNRFIDISEIAETAYMIGPSNLPDGEEIGIAATEYFDPPTSCYSNATHAVCVAIEADTGRVNIERYVVVHDCGRVLNPLIVDGQILGAIVQGIGSVLTEAVLYSEDGQPITTTLLDYAIPTCLDVPKIEMSHVETPSTSNPLGVKGVGESGIVGAVPAVVLAIANALSRFDAHFNKVPIMPYTLVDIMHPAAGATP